jgi:hypothetical protein
VGRASHLVLAAVSCLLAVPLRAIDFEAGFDVPESITGAPGELKVFDAFVTLTTSGAEGSAGAQGWLLLIRVDGGEIQKASVDGLEVDTLFDHDGDPATPLLDPHRLQLRDAGFNKHILYTSVPEDGTPASAVGINTYFLAVKRLELVPRGTQRIARLTVTTRVPADGSCAPVAFRVLEEDTPRAEPLPQPLSIFGRPLESLITYQGESQVPSKSTASTAVCRQTFRRGDANGDAAVDISDAITVLNFLFLDGDEPGCLDSADVNDDGRADISDAIFLLEDLFGPYLESLIPAPGPFGCGPDPTVDELGCTSSPCGAG